MTFLQLIEWCISKVKAPELPPPPKPPEKLTVLWAIPQKFQPCEHKAYWIGGIPGRIKAPMWIKCQKCGAEFVISPSAPCNTADGD